MSHTSDLQRRRFLTQVTRGLLGTAGLVISGSSLPTYAAGNTLDLSRLVNDRFGLLKQLLQQTPIGIPDIVALVESAQTGFNADQLDVVGQLFNSLTVVFFVSSNTGQLTALQAKQLQAMATLVLDAVLLASALPLQGHLFLGIYQDQDRQEAILNPFLNICGNAFRIISKTGQERLFELKECRSLVFTNR